MRWHEFRVSYFVALVVVAAFSGAWLTVVEQPKREVSGVPVAPGVVRYTDASQQNKCYLYRDTISCVPARTRP